jgi:magnesium-transporting ATPase (P-type)
MTEQALLFASTLAGVSKKELEKEYKLLDRLDFNSDRNNTGITLFQKYRIEYFFKSIFAGKIIS